MCVWGYVRPAGDYVPLTQPYSHLKDNRCTDKTHTRNYPDHRGNVTLPDADLICCDH